MYPNRIRDVKFISVTTKSNGRYVLKFQIYFTQQITQDNLRTEVVSNIQGSYYKLLKQYFASASKTMNIPTSVKISTPKSVRKSLKSTVFNRRTTSTQSGSSKQQISQTKISSGKHVFIHV